MALALGQLEIQVLAYGQARKQESLETGDLVEALGWTVEQERKTLSRLARKGLIARVRRGLYLVPSRLPRGGRWSPGEFLALSTLVSDRGGCYQISGPNTFHRYGWTDQVPNRIYAYNNRISGDRQIGSVALTLIKVADQRLGGTEVVRTPDGTEVVYASRARTLVDAVRDWSRFDSLPRAFRWIGQEVEKEEGLTPELVKASILFGNQGTLRRVGTVLERLDVAEHLLRRLDQVVRPSSSLIPLDPSRGKQGTANKRWGVVINDE
jgi:predicted transcriptional regulator of viral defense system